MPQKLPSTSVAPKEWQRIREVRSDPQVDPQRATDPGGAADAGAGEASWERRLRPRHRDVVRRFFSQTPQRAR